MFLFTYKQFPSSEFVYYCDAQIIIHVGRVRVTPQHRAMVWSSRPFPFTTMGSKVCNMDLECLFPPGNGKLHMSQWYCT